MAEIDAVSPEVLVCLGATAAQSLMGSSFRITQSRGQLFDFGGRRLMATLHPSAVLRMRSREERHAAMDMLVQDLKLVA
jgi:DNA polymerase